MTFDEFALGSSGGAEGARRDPVDVAEGARRGVDESDGVAGENLAFRTAELKAPSEMCGGILGGERLESETMLKAGVQRSVSSESESVAQVLESDEYDGE